MSSNINGRNIKGESQKRMDYLQNRARKAIQPRGKDANLSPYDGSDFIFKTFLII